MTNFFYPLGDKAAWGDKDFSEKLLSETFHINQTSMLYLHWKLRYDQFSFKFLSGCKGGYHGNTFKIFDFGYNEYYFTLVCCSHTKTPIFT